MKLNFLKFLSEEYPLEKAFFVVPKQLLLLVGLWPFSKLTLPHLFFIIYNAGVLSIGFSQYAFVIMHLNEPLLALDCFCSASSITITFFKYVYLVYKRPIYRECINECKELFFAGVLSSSFTVCTIAEEFFQTRNSIKTLKRGK